MHSRPSWPRRRNGWSRWRRRSTRWRWRWSANGRMSSGVSRTSPGGIIRSHCSSPSGKRRLEAAAALHQGRLSELETERLKLKAAGTAALDERRQVEASVPALNAAIRDVRQRLVGAQESQTSRVAQVRAREAEWTRLRHALAEVHKQQEAIRLRRVEAQTRLEGFEAMLTGTYALDFEEAAAEVGTTDAEKIETIKGALAQGRQRLSELGPVNVMAIDEHRELEERLRFLTAQDQDLNQSVASLKSIIT